jgi:hypothetical protein
VIYTSIVRSSRAGQGAEIDPALVVPGEVEVTQPLPPAVGTGSQPADRRPEAAILLPDLAQELQAFQQAFKSLQGSAGLGGSHAEEDPLTRDLIQRIHHKEIQQDPPKAGDLIDSTTTCSRVIEQERRRFTPAEKGKAIAYSASASIQLQGQHSPPTQPASSSKEKRNLHKGESSTAAVVKTHISTPKAGTSTPFGTYWREQHKDLQGSPSVRLHRSSSRDFYLIDEDGFRVVKPAYWWRKSDLHSRKDRHLHQPEELE